MSITGPHVPSFAASVIRACTVICMFTFVDLEIQGILVKWYLCQCVCVQILGVSARNTARKEGATGI